MRWRFLLFGVENLRLQVIAKQAYCASGRVDRQQGGSQVSQSGFWQNAVGHDALSQLNAAHRLFAIFPLHGHEWIMELSEMQVQKVIVWKDLAASWDLTYMRMVCVVVCRQSSLGRECLWVCGACRWKAADDAGCLLGVRAGCICDFVQNSPLQLQWCCQHCCSSFAAVS